MDLCAFVEAVSLHDRIRMIGKLSDKFHELFGPLFEAGVLIQHPTETRPIHPPRDHFVPTSRDPYWEEDYRGSDEENAWYETGRLNGAERQLGITALPMLRQRRYYTVAAQVPLHHSVCDLMGHYHDLGDMLQRLSESTRIWPVHFTIVPIPPIALEVIKISKSPEDFVRRSLEVREGYESIRLRLAELRATLADPSISPWSKRQYIDKWTKSWATLNRYESSPQALEFAYTSLGLLDQKITPSVDWQVSLRLSDLLISLAKVVGRRLDEWRVRVLHQTASRYLKTSDSTLAVEIERLFGRQPTSSEFTELQFRIKSAQAKDWPRLSR